MHMGGCARPIPQLLSLGISSLLRHLSSHHYRHTGSYEVKPPVHRDLQNEPRWLVTGGCKCSVSPEKTTRTVICWCQLTESVCKSRLDCCMLLTTVGVSSNKLAAIKIKN